MTIITNTTMETTSAGDGAKGLTRRSLFRGGAVGLGGAVLGFGTATVTGAFDQAQGIDANAHEGFGGETLSCHGEHQAGIATTPTAHTRYVSFRLKPQTDTAALVRMFRILTGDVEGLVSGDAPLADPEPELAARPSQLTITVGVGPGLVDIVDPSRRPEWLGPLPEFERDQLDGRHDGGDLLILLQADDPMPIAHAARMISRDLVSFAEPLWTQQGFRQARGSESDGTTMRNLMGQVDGTTNPAPEDEDFASLVWIDPDRSEEQWLAGGTALVLRRIRMELDTWDAIDRPGREQTIGRRLSDGAPLTAPAAPPHGDGSEFTPVDFEAKNEFGLTVIPSFAHIRRAHSEDTSERIVRRAVNYDDGAESGLLFGCYQRNPLKQFVPIQTRLDELDLLNEWVTHTGSAVFAMLPGFAPGETLGASLLK